MEKWKKSEFQNTCVKIEHVTKRFGEDLVLNQDDTIATDAEMRLAQPDGKRLRIGYSLVEAVEINIMIAAAVHFGKRQLHAVSPP